MNPRSALAAAAAILVAGCATVPSGPNIMVLPGPQKDLAQFQADQVSCQQYAIGGDRRHRCRAKRREQRGVAVRSPARCSAPRPGRSSAPPPAMPVPVRPWVPARAFCSAAPRAATPRVIRTTSRSGATTWRTRSACTRAATSCRDRWPRAPSARTTARLSAAEYRRAEPVARQWATADGSAATRPPPSSVPPGYGMPPGPIAPGPAVPVAPPANYPPSKLSAAEYATAAGVT